MMKIVFSSFLSLELLAAVTLRVGEGAGDSDGSNVGSRRGTRVIVTLGTGVTYCIGALVGEYVKKLVGVPVIVGWGRCNSDVGCDVNGIVVDCDGPVVNRREGENVGISKSVELGDLVGGEEGSELDDGLMIVGEYDGKGLGAGVTLAWLARPMTSKITAV